MIGSKVCSNPSLSVLLKQASQNFSINAVHKPKRMKKMKAWQIHGYGDLSELQLSHARIPILTNPDEVLIAVKAASLNPIDRAMIGGYGRTIFNFFRKTEIEFPLMLGRDFCGEIIDKGYNVGDKFRKGDKVYGFIPLHNQGSHAEITVANQHYIRHQPEHLSHVEAASIPYASMTAWGGIFVAGGLLLNDIKKSKVLILGASGGVGVHAVQLLKAKGATVIGSCSENALPLVKGLGADSVYDYRNPNYIQEVAAEGKFDLILDCAKFGYQNIPKNWIYKTFVTLNSPLLLETDKHGLVLGFASSMKHLLNSNVFNILEGRTVRWGFFTPSSEGFTVIDRFVKQKKINPVIHKVFKFSEMLEAFRTLEAGHLRGKIVIDFENK